MAAAAADAGSGSHSGGGAASRRADDEEATPLHAVAPRVWLQLGRVPSARDAAAVRAAGVTHVIQAAALDASAGALDDGFATHTLVLDVPEDEAHAAAAAAELAPHMSLVSRWIGAALASGPATGVLITSGGAGHRSAALAAAYLVALNGGDVASALARLPTPPPPPPYVDALLALHPPRASDRAPALLLHERIAADAPADACAAAGRAGAPTPHTAFLLPTDAEEEFGTERCLRDLTTHMHRVTPRVWLGDMFAAGDRAALADAGVTHVVCCIGEARAAFVGDLEYAVIDVGDTPEADIGTHFPYLTTFMSDALAASPAAAILVHCAAGASRSAAVVTAFLMARYGARAGEALAAVQAARCIANPNSGFRAQLLAWERTLFDGGV